MSIAPEQRAFTPDDLLALPDRNDFELVNGELVERNMSGLSSYVATEINSLVRNFVREHKLGIVLQSDCGYQCFAEDANRVRKPDGSFIRVGRITREELSQGYIRVAPDLVIEVVSPHDTKYEVDVKIEELLAAGVRLVWVLNPETGTIDVHRLDGTVGKLHQRDELSGEDVLPGFSCSVGLLFEVSGVSEDHPPRSL